MFSINSGCCKWVQGVSKRCKLGGYIQLIMDDLRIEDVRIVMIREHPVGSLFHKIPVLGGKKTVWMKFPPDQ